MRTPALKILCGDSLSNLLTTAFAALQTGYRYTAAKQCRRSTLFIVHVACESLFVHFGARVIGACGFGYDSLNKSSRKYHVGFLCDWIEKYFRYGKSGFPIRFGGNTTVCPRNGGETGKLAIGRKPRIARNWRAPLSNLVDGGDRNSQLRAIKAGVFAAGQRLGSGTTGHFGRGKRAQQQVDVGGSHFVGDTT